MYAHLFIVTCNILFPPTYVNLQAVDEFVLDLGLKELTSEKRCKITSLALNDTEWIRVRLFCNILQVKLPLHLTPSVRLMRDFYSACK
jgi:hypothetical protein